MEHPATPASMAPTVGRILIYALSRQDADAINRRRRHAREHIQEHRDNSNGVQIHVGNDVSEGQEFPMIVTRAWGPHCVNAQVFLDGNDLYWASSVLEGEGAGRWHWPVRA